MMKKLINIMLIGVFTFTFATNLFGQNDAWSIISEGEQHVADGNINSAIVSYNEAKRIADENKDWESMLRLSINYVEVRNEWAANNAYSLALRYSYDMAISDPSKTGIARDCRKGRSGLRAVIRFFDDVLSDMSVENPRTMSNFRFNQQQAKNALNWLNDKHGNGCPDIPAPNTGVTIRTKKSTYAPNEKIIVEFSGLPGNAKDWIAFVDTDTNKTVMWDHADEYESGEFTFSGLPAGKYEVQAFIEGADDVVAARHSFTVRRRNNPSPKIPFGARTSWSAEPNKGLKVGTIQVKYCAPKPTGSLGNKTVYGTDIYTNDSPICKAAVHAGIITRENGGLFKIQILAGQSSYKGSVRNGITSYNWNRKWNGSFRVLKY